MQPESEKHLDPAILAWNPPRAVDDEHRAMWADIVSVMPASRLILNNVPVIVAATRLKVKLNSGCDDTETLAALSDLLHFLGLTPESAGAVRGGREYDLPSGGEAS